jgi:hypothetical protein
MRCSPARFELLAGNMVLLIVMLHERRSALTAILLISGIFLGFGLFANIPALYKGFLVADQAVYYIMAQSLAFDGDLEYTTKDLIRYNEDYWAGPNGVFLKKVVKDGRERYFYAKSFAYALFAAPFVRILGPAGPIVFNGLMLFLLLLMGWNYFSLGNSPGLALGKMAAYLGASVAFLYALWITPEFFNMFLVFAVLFLWRYKAEAAKARAEIAAGQTPVGAISEKPGFFKRFLLSGGSDYLAAAVAGLVVFSKPTNIVLTAPLFLSTLLIGKKLWKAVALGFVLVTVTAAFFAANKAWTGEWNYQGGVRKTFVYQFPLEHKGVTFDSAPGRIMSTDGYTNRLKGTLGLLPYNMFWYVFGRFTGIMWYFFPAILFFWSFLRGRKSLDAWLILAAALGQILVYLVMMPRRRLDGQPLLHEHLPDVFVPAGHQNAQARDGLALGHGLHLPGAHPAVPDGHHRVARHPRQALPLHPHAGRADSDQRPADQRRADGFPSAMGYALLQRPLHLLLE